MLHAASCWFNSICVAAVNKHCSSAFALFIFPVDVAHDSHSECEVSLAPQLLTLLSCNCATFCWHFCFMAVKLFAVKWVRKRCMQIDGHQFALFEVKVVFTACSDINTNFGVAAINFCYATQLILNNKRPWMRIWVFSELCWLNAFILTVVKHNQIKSLYTQMFILRFVALLSHFSRLPFWPLPYQRCRFT